ncbi:hypothetical protein C8046_11945 [Serinibacter arcticus]|uniref:Secreted protein n=1 Tax=Serinibacter arcticus TaxID=1655435 RepID=A0A2U1ZWB3_9MICO|nr:hypothetical protein [Serinibacter arcticus]PWD51261.1 hypothetical protein C8046_11945 [Serinibacter arcticus]
MLRSTPSRHAQPALVALAATSAVALSACSAFAAPQTLGDTVDLDGEAPAVALTVTAATAHDAAELGLAGLLGTDLDGVPWLVDYRVDLEPGAREGLSFEDAPALNADAWEGRTSSTLTLAAASVGGWSAADCPGVVDDPAADALVSCHVFVVPEGQTLDSVSVEGAGTWDLSAG